MIIKQLNIYGFGRWIDQLIDIKNPLQIVYGQNEAGKSTIIAFIKGVLFGFTDKKHSVHGQYQPKGSAPYGGEITFSSDHHLYKVVRTGLKYGGTVKFYDLDNDTELSEDDYQQLITPIDRTAYDQLFYFGSIDQTEFYKMGRDELRLRIQSIGVAGAGDWMNLQADLDKQSAKLYAPRGRTKTINVQIAAYKKLEDQVSAAKDHFPRYQDLRTHLKRDQSDLNDLQVALKAANHQLDDKRRLQTVLPLVNKLSDLSDVDSAQVKAKFSSGDLNAFNKLNMALTSQKAAVQKAQKVVDADAGKTVKTPAQAFYETHSDTIERLAQGLPEIRKAALAIELGESQQKDVQQQIQAQLDSINKNEQGGLPRPFDDQTFAKVNELLRKEQNLQEKRTQRTRQRPVQPDQHHGNGLIWYGVAIAFAVLSLLLGSKSFGWVGYILAAAAAVWGWYTAKGGSKRQTDQTREDPAELDRQLTQIRGELTAIQTQFDLQGIDKSQWLHMQSSLQEIQRLKKSYQNQQDTLAQQQAKYQGYLDQWQFATDWLKFDQSKYSAAVETIGKAVAHWHKLVTDYQQQQTTLNDDQKTLNAATTKLAELVKQKRAFLESRDVDDDEAFQQSVTFQSDLAKKLEQKTTFESQIKSANVVIPAKVDQDALNTEVHEATKQVQGLQDQLTDLSREMTQFQTEIDGLIKDGKYYDLRQQLANQQAEIVSNVQKYLALKLSSQWIQAVLDIASKGRLPKTLELAKQYFATLTNDAYKDIIFKKEISVVRKDDVSFPINELSTGTLEQLYLALIFSMAVGFSNQYPMPIIIDDGFVNFDQSRKKAALMMLQQVSEKTQVLYFTANLEGNADNMPVLDLKTL
ncbi:DNA repair ATPase [Lentilactobacillus parakefiri]|uniref:ATP-binding protein n=1 Tax=Lentilactobacillus parakefiri TaxID=152332 RepID=UPI000BA68FAF|nr:AAA family ATPase [Lentilactobacillus parakefiri]PAL00947.1 DNA repair ATPase [Lentilactobacillus parakefiri]